jgi:hypothetical protein
MHMAVDDAGQHMQTAAVDDLTGAGARKIADHGKTAAADAEIADALAVLVDDGAAFEDEIVGFGHLPPRDEGLRARNSAYVSP